MCPKRVLLFCDLEYAYIIKFKATCWLWLELCVNWEVKKYFELKCYFRLENFTDRRFRRLQTSFNDSMTEVELLFYQAVLPSFTTFNKLLQPEELLIHIPYDSQQRFMFKLTSRFIKPSVIQNYEDLGNPFFILASDYQDRWNDTELGIGIIT